VQAVFGIEQRILIRRCPDIDRDHNLVDTNVQSIFHMAENCTALAAPGSALEPVFPGRRGRDAGFKIY
jgi:hypothetical protein